MFGCNPLGSSLGRIVHHGQGAVVDMGNNLVPEREESILVGFLVLVNVNGRDFKGTVSLGVDFITGHAFIVLLDVNHQHM